MFFMKLFEPWTISSLSSVIIWVRVVLKNTLISKMFENGSVKGLRKVIVWVTLVLQKTCSVTGSN